MAPYYYRRRWRTRRRRPRYYRWRWPRRSFRRRLFRKRWVSKLKRKLTKLTVKEYQPLKIRKLTIKGIYPCFIANHYRLSNNLPQWIDSIAPQHFPGGGGFSILQFTLLGLYELFQKGTNWWTTTNCNLPLIRYNYCNLKFYRTQGFDYVVNIIRCFPMKSNDTMYMNTQPSIMMLNKKAIFVPCKESNRNRKNYVRVKVRPPAQMQTHWYFQQKLCNVPLLIILISACSLDRYYTSSTAKSTTIGFTSLNTTTFQYHNWKKPPTSGYVPQDKLAFWGLKAGSTDPPENAKVEELVYLGNTLPLTQGKTIKDKTTIETYSTDMNAWGNIFDPEYLIGNNPIFSTNKSMTELKNALTSKLQNTIASTGLFTIRTIPNLRQCRYNPLKDKGIGNKIFLVSITSDINTWHEPTNPKLMRQDLPLWILTWGWLDWQKKLQEVHLIDNEYLTVIVSNYIEPFMHFYVVLDDNFFNENPTSPFSDTLSEGDTKNFHPKNAFQLKTLNEIACSGPGVIKLPPDHSCEAHFKYDFHFKLGGCPAPMDTICNPSEQPIYPIPDTKQQTNSLQSPGQAIQTYLYNFDERQGQLTKKATKRIKKDYESQKTLLPITGTAMDLQASPLQTSTRESTTSEEEEEDQDIFHQLKQLRKQQRGLRHRILQLIQNLQ